MKKLLITITLILTVSLSGFSTRASTVIITGPEVIHKAKDSILTISDILSLYQSSNGNVAISYDNYTGNGNKIGEYDIELYVTNESVIESKVISVNVIEYLPSNVKWITDNDKLYVGSNTKITWENEIKDALLEIGLININSSTRMYITDNTYSDNHNKQGEYNYEFRLVDSSGNDVTRSIKIVVLATEDLQEPDYVSPKPKGLLDSISAFLLNIWSFIEVVLLVLAILIGYKFLKRKGLL